MATAPSPGVLQRITLILDETLEKEIVEQAQRLGAESYICSYCSGKPLHDAIEAHTPRAPLVRIELLVQLQTAPAILAYLRQLQQMHYPLTAVIDAVTAIP